MPAITSTAPGKIILFGEHAVVYGRPAIALPVTQVRARAVISANPTAPTGQVRVQAPDVGLMADLVDLPAEHPLATAIHGVLRVLHLPHLPACTIRVTSTIPVAAGLGSGAATSVALVRALSTFCGAPLPDETVNALAYEVEKLHHGTPSGIDNTVITYEMPVYYVREQPIQRFTIAREITIVIGDTGRPSSTAITVGNVRAGWQADPARYKGLFDRIGAISEEGRRALETGDLHALGNLMHQNHALLAEIDVSSPQLERLVAAARAAGALGAKLSGGGGGGNMIALVEPDRAAAVTAALEAAGATRTLVTTLRPQEGRDG
jgi:mevalonate kinase